MHFKVIVYVLIAAIELKLYVMPKCQCVGKLATFLHRNLLADVNVDMRVDIISYNYLVQLQTTDYVSVHK